MSVRRELVAIAELFARNIYTALPFAGIKHPIFIIGCGRSGTTILGTALSKHRRVMYLNEPRGLWAAAYPQTDIWSPDPVSRNAKLVFSREDVERDKSDKLKRLFRFETIRHRRPVLIEKSPANNLRLEFVRGIFPDARFIHIFRNGLEVARSIEQLTSKGKWFGPGFYKWDRLVDYANGTSATSRLPSLCASAFEKGLLEWRLSTESAVRFLHGIPSEAFVEVNYEHFVGNPARVISRLLAFIGVGEDPGVNTFVTDEVSRRSSKANQTELTAKMRDLGGDLLPKSMEGGTTLL